MYPLHPAKCNCLTCTTRRQTIEFNAHTREAAKHLLCFKLMLPTLLALLAGLEGCTALRTIEPNSLPIEYTHVSHLTQHEPFTSSPTSYGYNAISIGAKWRLDPHLTVQISEGLILDHRYVYRDGEQSCGSMFGPREVFTGRITYEVPLK